MKTNLTIAEMIRDIESRLTVGPDGDMATAPSGEAYVTFTMVCPAENRHDSYIHNIGAELIAALWGVLTTYKTDQTRLGAKFIRWRKRPVIEAMTNSTSIYCRVLPGLPYRVWVSGTLRQTL